MIDVFPKVLVSDEKSITRYFLIENVADLAKASIEILRTRVEDGWIQEPEMPEIPKDPAFKLTPDEIKTLEELSEVLKGDLLDRHKQVVNRYKSDMTEYAREKQNWDLIQSLLNEDVEFAAQRIDTYGKPLGWSILNTVAQNEYGSIELEYFETYK